MSKRKRANRQKQGILTNRRKPLTTRMEAQRNLTDLPWDVMLLIFMKLGVLEIFRTAQNVCSLWLKLAKEPILYRSLDISDFGTYLHTQRKRDPIKKFEYLAKEAVDRSCGQLFELSCDSMATREVLLHLNLNLYSLRCLRLGPAVYLSECALAEVVNYLHSLEELELWFSDFPEMAIQQLGLSCPKLASFRLCQWHNMISFDTEASFLVQNMPRLRYLGLVGSELTNRGLQIILDGCAHLERLDLRHSSGVDVDKSMFERCVGKIRDVLLPDESSFGCMEVLITRPCAKK